MRYFFLLFFLTFTLMSCESVNDPGRIYSLEILQSNVNEQFMYGEEHLYGMKEIISDKTNSGEGRFKIKFLYKSFLEIDSITGISISKIEKIKKEMFMSFHENLSLQNQQSILHYDARNKKLSHPINYLLSNVKYVGGSSILKDNQKNIIALIREYRGEICRVFVSTYFRQKNERPLFFKDPQINDFKDEKDFSEQYELKIKQSEIARDQLEVVKSIYWSLSKTDKQWESILNKKDSWTDVLSILLYIENDILSARAVTFRQILYLVTSCREYGFTSIFSIVEGPSCARVGDTVVLRVMEVAHNENKKPEFETSSNGILEKVENGVGYVKVVIPAAKETEVSGVIIQRKKDGMPRTIKWAHKIKVMSNED